MKIKNHNPQGFTLIELLMVVLIIMLIMTAGTFSYQNQRRHVEFNDAVLKIMTLIKTARNYAITSRSTYDTCQIPGEETYVPAEGYGVYLERDPDTGLARFVLFANTIADTEIRANQYDKTADPCTSDLIEEEFVLNGKAAFTAMLTDLTPPGTPFSSSTNAEETKAVIIYKTSLADATVAANDHPVDAADLTFPVDLYLVFERPTSGATALKSIVHINRLAGFPEIEYQ